MEENKDSKTINLILEDLDDSSNKELEKIELKDDSQPFELNELNPKLDVVPLERENIQLINDIIKETDLDNIKNMTKKFQLNQGKKNLLRIVKLNNLLDKVNDQAIERVEKRPDEIATKELLDYMRVVQESIERSESYINTINETPMIQLMQQNNITNINVDPLNNLNKESKEKILDAINKLVKQVEKIDVKEPVIIDATIVETKEKEKEENK